MDGTGFIGNDIRKAGSVIEKLLKRVARIGECLEWTGALDNSQTPIHKVKISDGVYKNRSVRRTILEIKTHNYFAIQTCGNPLCIEPKHLRSVTRKTLQKLTAQRSGYGQCEIRRLKISKARREKGTALDMDKVREMRAAGLSSRQAAKKYGIAQSTAHDVLSGRTWREHNFFSGLIAANSSWSKQA